MVHSRTRVRVLSRGRTALFLTIAAALMATAGWATNTSRASSHFFCQNLVVTAHGNCYGDDHTLTGVVATDDINHDRVCAAAHYNGALYASYICGNGSAEHCYGATHLLKPLIHNEEDFNQYMHGYETWGDSVCP